MRAPHLIFQALFSILLLCSCDFLHAQDALTKVLSGTFDEITLVEFLEAVENSHGTKFYYEPDKVPYYKRSFSLDATPMYIALEHFLEGSTLDVIKFGPDIVLANKLTITRREIEQMIAHWQAGTYKKPISYEMLSLTETFGDSIAPAGRNVALKGYIRDKYSQEAIIGAVLQDQKTGLGATSDEDGFFTMSVKPGRYRIHVSFLGYQTIDWDVGIYNDAARDFDMQVNALNLSEIVVEASSIQDKTEETQLGIEEISIREIREIPSFLGEADVLKSLETLPGVTTAGEASSGFNVRGGTTDQNLIILDNALLFNASHALGFFSIFNADAVRSVSLYKGSIPAQYGGRLSSVLEVGLKDGNRKKWQGRGGVGLASARLVLDGPLGARTGVVTGLRSSYSNWLLNLIKTRTVKNSRIYFGDALVKVTHDLSDRSRLSLTGYGSHDSFEFDREFGYSWTSIFGALNWRYLAHDQLSVNTSLVRGLYDSEQFVPTGENAFSISNGISYWNAKSKLTFQNEKHFVNAGFEGYYLDMDPEEIRPYNAISGVREEAIFKDQGLELGVFVDDDISLSDRLSMAFGLRFSYFTVLGPAVVREYAPDEPRTPQSVISSELIPDRSVIKSYHGFEPRFALNWRFRENQAVKVSFNRINQYIHLLSGTASATPVDIWQLSNAHIPGQKGDNYSLGWIWNASEKFEISLEGYYKRIEDFVQFKDLASLLLQDQIETQIILGEARSYGGEVSIRKKVGDWTGSLGYTYSRSQARTRGVISDEVINGNQWYFAPFDQPHQLNLQFKRSPNPVQHLSIALVIKSGRPVTAPVANYSIQDVLITHYADRNTFRVPLYHRLDIGYTIDRSQSKLKGFRSSFTASFFNLYGRQNAYSVYFRRGSNGVQRAYKLSVLGSIFPSFTWNFAF